MGPVTRLNPQYCDADALRPSPLNRKPCETRITQYVNCCADKLAADDPSRKSALGHKQTFRSAIAIFTPQKRTDMFALDQSAPP